MSLVLLFPDLGTPLVAENTYLVVSSTNPDLLDLYVDGVKVLTFTVDGITVTASKTIDGVDIGAHDHGAAGGVKPSGTYTPTLTNVANIAASTAYQCQYARIGDVVMVSGRVDIDPILASVVTQLGISLPIASNFTRAGQEECAGTGHSPGISMQSAAIKADTTNDRAELYFLPFATSAEAMLFIFSYVIV